MRTRWKLSVLAVIPLLGTTPGAAEDKPASPSAILQKAADDYWSFLETESLAIRVREGLPVDRMPDISLEHSKSNAAFWKTETLRYSCDMP